MLIYLVPAARIEDCALQVDRGVAGTNQLEYAPHDRGAYGYILEDSGDFADWVDWQ